MPTFYCLNQQIPFPPLMGSLLGRVRRRAHAQYILMALDHVPTCLQVNLGQLLPASCPFRVAHPRVGTMFLRTIQPSASMKWKWAPGLQISPGFACSRASDQWHGSLAFLESLCYDIGQMLTWKLNVIKPRSEQPHGQGWKWTSPWVGFDGYRGEP